MIAYSCDACSSFQHELIQVVRISEHQQADSLFYCFKRSRLQRLSNTHLFKLRPHHSLFTSLHSCIYHLLNKSLTINRLLRHAYPYKLSVLAYAGVNSSLCSSTVRLSIRPHFYDPYSTQVEQSHWPPCIICTKYEETSLVAMFYDLEYLEELFTLFKEISLSGNDALILHELPPHKYTTNWEYHRFNRRQHITFPTKPRSIFLLNSLALYLIFERIYRLFASSRFPVLVFSFLSNS